MKGKEVKRIVNLDVKEISLVDSPAILRTFLIIKRESGMTEETKTEPTVAVAAKADIAPVAEAATIDSSSVGTSAPKGDDVNQTNKAASCDCADAKAARVAKAAATAAPAPTVAPPVEVAPTTIVGIVEDNSTLIALEGITKSLSGIAEGMTAQNKTTAEVIARLDKLEGVRAVAKSEEAPVTSEPVVKAAAGKFDVFGNMFG